MTLIGLLAAVSIAAACTGSPANPAPEKTADQIAQEYRNWVFDGVGSACDQFGNRVYKYDRYREGGIAVVPADLTCVPR